MKKIIAVVFCVALVAVLMGSFAIAQEKKDAKGYKDHSLFTRMPAPISVIATSANLTPGSGTIWESLWGRTTGAGSSEQDRRRTCQKQARRAGGTIIKRFFKKSVT